MAGDDGPDFEPGPGVTRTGEYGRNNDGYLLKLKNDLTWQE
ncbi:MAG TPA: hypothetical protein VGB30_06800 [bacterium]|jgi:hypothetical protein